VSYEFVGTFVKWPGDSRSNETVLSGHLRKLAAGRVAGEADVRFSYFLGD
jgi:hypothetical protein